jgi:hypothetical protein
MGEVRTKTYRSAVIYGMTVVPLIATLSYYFLEHVPSREEYLLNLRFRNLGVIGKQIEIKLESVSSGLVYGGSVAHVQQARANGARHRVSLDEYVGYVFPELQRPEGQALRDTGPARDQDSAIDPDVMFVPSADRVRFTISPAERPWETSLANLIAPTTEDTGFDDVLLVDGKTNAVLFQRSDSTPRVRDVAAILKRPENKETGLLDSLHRLHSDGGGADTDLLRDIDLDGSAYRFLAEPLTIRVPRSPGGKVKELLLCGLIRSDKIRTEAMHVPPKYLLWIIVPLFAAALSGPLLKLILMRRTGRFATRDVPLLALFSCLAMAMLTVVLLAFHLSERNTARLEEGSKELANRLAGQVVECFRRGREVLRQVDVFAADSDRAATGPVSALNRTGIWSWSELVRRAPAITRTNLEFLFWTSETGHQIEKWTPLETNTPFYPQRTSGHYLAARAGECWRARNDPSSPFTAELLISPTTASPIAVLTMPARRHTPLKTDTDRNGFDPSVPASLSPAFISIVETPADLLSPVIPPAMGFALVRGDGAVLYHSDRDRILNENLFRETENSRALVNAVAAQTEKRLEGRYRGSDVVFYVRPIREVSGIPWTIIVFREIEPWQTLVWQVGFDVLLLYLLLWILPVIAIPLSMLAVRARRRCSWNSCRILALRYFWPREHAASRYAAVAAIQCTLILGFLAALGWFAKRPDGAAGTVLLVDALLSPAIALAVWTWLLYRTSRETTTLPSAADSAQCGAITGNGWRNVYIAALCLTLVSVSVLPVTGLFHLAFRLESEIDTRHWQSDLANRILRHRAAAEAAVRQPGKLSAEAMAVALRLALPAEATGLCDQERLYEAWSHTTVRCQTMQLPDPATPFWRTALLAVRARAFALDDATVAVGRFGSVIRTGTAQPTLAISLAGAPDLVVTSDLWTLPVLPRSLGWWIVAGLVLTAGCVWAGIAAIRLFLFDFHELPLRTLGQLKRVRPEHPILVLGLPRSGKDTAVKEFIAATELASAGEAEPAPGVPAVSARVDLKAEVLDEKWLDKVFDDLGLETFRTPPPVDVKPIQPRAAAAVAAGRGTPGSVSIDARPSGGPDAAGPAEPRTPTYTHVTNLEAALNEQERRNTAMRLLDVLARAHAARMTTLMVTSAVDPMVHLDIIFPDRDEEIERNHLPEAEFGHWAHVFIQFERVVIEERQSAVADAERDCRTGAKIDKELWAECRWFPSLRRVGMIVAEEVKQRIAAGKPEPTHEELIEEVSDNAAALYKLLWSACTRPEKLLLVQLAQTGLANPSCTDTLHDLLRKRLILLTPCPTIMNESFGRFLLSAASSEQIQAWENEGGESHWLTVRNVLLIVLVFVLLMIGVSQDHALQSISGILTAVVGGVGGVFKLIETVAAKWGRPSAQAGA